MQEGVRQVGLAKLLLAFSRTTPTSRLYRLLDDDYGPAILQLSWDAFGVDSVDYYWTKALAYRKDQIRGPAYHDSIAEWAAPRVHREPGSQCELILVLASRGQGSRPRPSPRSTGC